MKMKEVCIATGLTERAVRFYVKEQLLSPQTQSRSGRIWLDFSEDDVARLRAIATLRRAGFTIEEIRSMVHDYTSNAAQAAFALRQRLRETIDTYERLIRTDTAQAEDLEGYAALLAQEVKSAPLPAADQQPFLRLNWSSIIETLCMLLFVYGAWRLYVFCVDRFSEFLFVLARNPLVFILAFVILPLPAALVLGSRLGKWLCTHFAYIP